MFGGIFLKLTARELKNMRSEQKATQTWEVNLEKLDLEAGSLSWLAIQLWSHISENPKIRLKFWDPEPGTINPDSSKVCFPWISLECVVLPEARQNLHV